MIPDWMITDMNHEREMLMWFALQKRCTPIRNDVGMLLTDVVHWMASPTHEGYPALCKRTAELSGMAWDHIHGYAPREKLGAA